LSLGNDDKRDGFTYGVNSLKLNPDLAGKKDAQPIKGHVRVFSAA